MGRGGGQGVAARHGNPARQGFFRLGVLAGWPAKFVLGFLASPGGKIGSIPRTALTEH
jgi:hypothetical protein